MVDGRYAAMLGEGRRQRYRDEGWWIEEALVDRYRRASAGRGESLAVADSRGRRLTHAQLWTCAERFAEQLRERGVQERSVVLLIMPNRVEWQVANLAVLMLGASPAVAPTTTDPETLTYMCDLSDAVVVVGARCVHGADQGDYFEAAVARTSQPVSVALFDDAGEPQWREATGSPGEHVLADRGDLEHLMFTSSTTGPAKLVVHTRNSLSAFHVGFTERYALGKGDVIFMSSPLGHSMGALHGGRLALFLAIPLILQERWDPMSALDMIDDFGCTFTGAATTFLQDLMSAERPSAVPKMSTMRTFLCGGAPVPPSLLEKAHLQCPATFVGVLWGMTEGGNTTGSPGDPVKTQVNTCGRPLPGLELKVVPVSTEFGEEAGDATGIGELAIRGPAVSIGYYRNQALHDSLVTDDGYFRTGDLARIDEDGFLHMVGRVKDLIIRGGVNIAPLHIEDCLTSHPQVRRVAVVGSPDERLGERICAVVDPVGDTIELDDLKRWADQHGLPKRHWPESVRILRDMPLNAAGKIKKNELVATLFGQR